MQFALAALALAAGVSANYPVAGNVTYTTAVVTSYETYCPEATTLTYGTKTYAVSTPGTVTITDCPVTVVTPIYSTSSVVCNGCSSAKPPAPVYPTLPPAPPANNTTSPVKPVVPATTPVKPTAPAPTYPAVPTAAAGKVVAGVAGVLAAVAAAL